MSWTVSKFTPADTSVCNLFELFKYTSKHWVDPEDYAKWCQFCLFKLHRLSDKSFLTRAPSCFMPHNSHGRPAKHWCCCLAQLADPMFLPNLPGWLRKEKPWQVLCCWGVLSDSLAPHNKCLQEVWGTILSKSHRQSPFLLFFQLPMPCHYLSAAHSSAPTTACV